MPETAQEFLVEMGIGWAGSAAGIAVTHPLDTMRVRVQHFSGAAGLRTYFYPYHQSRVSTGLVDIARDIYNLNGLRGFYRGIVPPVAWRGVSFAAGRGAYALAENLVPKGLRTHRRTTAAIAGSISGGLMAMCENPIYYLKTKGQTSERMKDESLRTYYRLARKTVLTQGWAGLWTGGAAQFSLFFGSWGLLYFAYEDFVMRGFAPATSGALAAVCCWPVFYPFDVIRTQMITASAQGEDKIPFRQMARAHFTQPFREWCPGLSITLLRALPRFYVCFGVMGYLRQFQQKPEEL